MGEVPVSPQRLAGVRLGESEQLIGDALWIAVRGLASGRLPDGTPIRVPVPAGLHDDTPSS